MQKAQRVPIKTTTSSKPLQVFDENVIPGAKPLNTRKVATTVRTTLGELTNITLNRKVEKKPEVNTVISQRIPLVRKTSTTATTRPKVVPTKPSNFNEKALGNYTSNIQLQITAIPNESLQDPFAFMEEDPKPTTMPVEKNEDMMDLEQEMEEDDENEISLKSDCIEDIDAGDEEDPQFCSEYVTQIFNYCREKEVKTIGYLVLIHIRFWTEFLPTTFKRCRTR